MASDGGATSWGTLPAEIRLLVYAYVLRFQCPIKKKPTKRATSKPRGTKPNGLKNPFALLLVNKQTLHEALPVLYECNTISITHMGLHHLKSPARQLDLAYVKQLNIRLDPLPRDVWFKCFHCWSIAPMVRLMTSEAFGSLEKVSVQFNLDWVSSGWFPDKATKVLQMNGMDIEFTQVGRFRITGLGQSLQVIFENAELVEVWERAATEQIRENSLPWEMRESLDTVRMGIDDRLVTIIFNIFFVFRAPTHPLVSKAASTFARTGIQPSWLRPETLDGPMMENITRRLCGELRN